MNTGIEFAEKLSKAYSETCKPLCHELNIPQTALTSYFSWRTTQNTKLPEIS